MSRKRGKKHAYIPEVHVTVPHEILREKIESSIMTMYPCFDKLSEQVQNRQIEKMICLGIGDPCKSMAARIQLSFITRLCKRAGVSNILFSDPVVCDKCIEVIEEMGLTVDREDKLGQYNFSPTTAFFMPHCPRFLYHNLLAANWSRDAMSSLFVIGNSFKMYSDKYKLMMQTKRTCIEDLFDTNSVTDEPLNFSGTDFFSETSLMTLNETDYGFDTKPTIMKSD